MKIIIDAFGGDNAPLEVLRGCALAVQEYGVQMVAVGDEPRLRALCQQNQISLAGMELVHAPLVIPVEADPTKIRTEYADSSMAVGLRLLADGGGDAFVSAGSTGALVMGSSLLVKRIRGIKRAAIACLIPTMQSRYMLIDGGANTECRPEMLTQFAVMGSAYMECIYGIRHPRVGLVNIGTEDTKGTELQVQAHSLLAAAPIHFVGNVEPREIPLDGCDVAVCDGFTGNVILKLTEGLGKAFSGQIKSMFLRSVGTKLAYLAMKGGVADFKKKMDYTEYGGAPLMGIAKPVVKAHGSSDAKAFKNAIRQAKEMVENRVIDRVEESLAAMKEAAQ